MSKKKFSRFQYFLSYFFDQQLFTTQSLYNSLLEVNLSRGRLQLNTDNATYSFEDLYEVFYQPFQQLKFKEKSFEKVLVLGGGLACIPQMLEQNFKQKAQYTVVEIDEEVINICQNFLSKKLLQSIDFQCMDAYDFVKTSTQTYDLITIDIFLDTITPNKFRELPFLKQVKQCLQPAAWVLYNFYSPNTALQKKGKKFHATTFKKVFPSSHILRTPTNSVLIYQHP